MQFHERQMDTADRRQGYFIMFESISLSLNSLDNAESLPGKFNQIGEQIGDLLRLGRGFAHWERLLDGTYGLSNDDQILISSDYRPPKSIYSPARGVSNEWHCAGGRHGVWQ